MILWKVEKLAQQLKLNELSEWQKMKYLLWDAVLMSFALGIMNMSDHYASSTRTSYGILFLLIECILVYLLVEKAFLMNDKGDGKAFIERFTCLAFPISIRVSVMMILLEVLIALPMRSMGFKENGFISTVVEYSVGILWTIYFYHTLTKWLGYVSGADEKVFSEGVQG